MKNLLYFLLSISLLSLSACTEYLEPASLEIVETESENKEPFTEYEGTVSLANDSMSIYLEHSDQPERDEYIDIRWTMFEHIYFVSEKFEFDNGDSNIWGADSCAQFDSGPVHQDTDENGVTWLYFEPDAGFWRCLEAENCDPGDEVFCFHLMVRERG